MSWFKANVYDNSCVFHHNAATVRFYLVTKCWLVGI